MSRYIDADDYRKKWADIFDSAYGDSCCEMFKKSIDEQPTADVVPKDKYDRLLISATKLAEAVRVYQIADLTEVVRCKDCRHRDPEDKKCDCGELERAGCVFPMRDDYFCADGKRRGDE